MKKFEFSFNRSYGENKMPIITFCIGDKRFRFLLDTGCTANIISSKFISEIPVIERKKGNFELINTNNSTDVTDVVSVMLEKRKFRCACDFIVSDLSYTATGGVYFHGILGNLFFSTFKANIDYNNKIFTIYE